MISKIIGPAVLAAAVIATVVTGTANAQVNIPSGDTVILVNGAGEFTVDDIRALAQMGAEQGVSCAAEVQKQVDKGASFPNDGKNVMLQLCEEAKSGS